MGDRNNADRFDDNALVDPLAELDEREKQALVRDCVDRINIYKDKVEIFYTFIKTEGATKKAA